jgi:hypothetical protein
VGGADKNHGTWQPVKDIIFVAHYYFPPGFINFGIYRSDHINTINIVL